MARPQKYPWDKIEIDYKAGLSQSELHNKYEVPYNRLSERCKEWEQSELAKSVIKGFDDISEQVTELKGTSPELVQPVLDIVSDKHPQFKKAMVALSSKLFNRMLKLADDAEASDINSLAKGMQTITDTLGISQRHAPKQDINLTNAQQNNITVEIE
jgi:hypothetical protein